MPLLLSCPCALPRQTAQSLRLQCAARVLVSPCRVMVNFHSRWCCSCMTGWLFGPCTQEHGPGSPTIRVGKGWRGRRELAPRCSATQFGAFRNEPGLTRRFLNYSYHTHHTQHTQHTQHTTHNTRTTRAQHTTHTAHTQHSTAQHTQHTQCTQYTTHSTHSTTQHHTAPHSTTQHNTAQHSTTQHNTAPHSTPLWTRTPGPAPVCRALKTHPEQASRYLLNLHNRIVDHLVNELQLGKLYGLLEQSRPRQPASAP